MKLDGDDFIGRDALRAQQAAGITRKLTGFVMTERGIARHGYAIFDDDRRRLWDGDIRRPRTDARPEHRDWDMSRPD